MSKVGIYGGTFNPIHDTHFNIAKEALEQFSLDKVIFLVAGDPPHKSVDDSQVLASDRVEMINLAIKDCDRMSVDDREIRREGKSYTYLTLEEYTKEFPEDEFYFIMGSDSIDYFDKWKNPDIISKLSHIIVAMREGDDKEHILSVIENFRNVFPGNFYLLNLEKITGVSSTEIRKKLQNKDFDELPIDDEVLAYIRDHKLYQSSDFNYKTVNHLLKEMKDELKESRYNHTVGVAHTASNLAFRWHYPVMDAMIAGILHDCAKCISDEKRLEICNKNDLPVSDLEAKFPHLLHGKVGAFWTRTKYKIEDENICHAIEYHTTGCPDMNLLDKIIFVADYIEPGRDKQPRLPAVREMAYIDLDKCIYMILEDTVSYLYDNGDLSSIDETTIRTYEFYKNIFRKE